MTLKQSKADEKAQAVERLRALLPVGSKVYCILRHVARSGMSRRIAFYSFDGIGERKYLSGYISRVLYPQGFGCIGEGCPSNDHSNGDRDYTPHATACDCRPCAVCGGSDPVICAKCLQCTRERGHAHGCEGCSGTLGVHGHPHWHGRGSADYAFRSEWL